MSFYPPLVIAWSNGFLLIIPLLALRYGLPALQRKNALAELDYFPPVQGPERLALKTYFLSNTFLVFSPLLAEIKPAPGFKLAGWTVYLGGLIILALGLISYCQQEGLKTGGIYRYSRNPLCVGYLFLYLGTALLISSWFHLLLTIVYQTAVHGLILSEERWCMREYGASYQEYSNSVPRYIFSKDK